MACEQGGHNTKDAPPPARAHLPLRFSDLHLLPDPHGIRPIQPPDEPHGAVSAWHHGLVLVVRERRGVDGGQDVLPHPGGFQPRHLLAFPAREPRHSHAHSGVRRDGLILRAAVLPTAGKYSLLRSVPPAPPGIFDGSSDPPRIPEARPLPVRSLCLHRSPRTEHP